MDFPGGICEFMTRNTIDKYILKLKQNQFLFEELVKRDFKRRYVRAALGIIWSVLSPLLSLLVMRLVFTQFFGRNTPHYTTYLFCGMIIFSYFSEATREGMSALSGNASIFTKINVPKYLFLFAKNVQTFINFLLILVVFFLFCLLDHVTFSWRMLLLVYPIMCLIVLNIGTGLVLSAMYIFFRDTQYLWTIFLQLLQYLSVIFYRIETFSPKTQQYFYLNPIYLYIRYFRKIVLDLAVPSLGFHALMLAEALLVFSLGAHIYRKYNLQFLYYV